MNHHHQSGAPASIPKQSTGLFSMAQVFVHVKYCIGGQPAVGDEVTFDIELFGPKKLKRACRWLLV